ncbi:hypothetical protein HH214_04360 [Mucilaginibacter robiniae]|uniref:Uncharacterized protein n=1 Tax=Mucilaginibacter robiniae TaxID=2728022 RepID=A0A7L5E489_9SPHI|nr:hypothetical protein [Mucilaginibacter robiniae]QJD95166.1 hypothetical protein HH214_04360 [Mucilaginibacter robiniae]
MRETPDIWEHANKTLSAVDANFMRGGGRVTTNLSTLLTDFVTLTDQLKENVTQVYVISEAAFYLLKSIVNIGNLARGWKAITVQSDTMPTLNSVNPVQSGGVYTALTAKATLPDGVTEIGHIRTDGNIAYIDGFVINYNALAVNLPMGQISLDGPPVTGQFTRMDAIYYDPVRQTYGKVTGNGNTNWDPAIIPIDTYRLADVQRNLDGTSKVYSTYSVAFISNVNIDKIYADKVMNGKWYSEGDAVQFGTSIDTPGRVGYRMNFKRLFFRSEVQVVTDSTANKDCYMVFPAGLIQNGGFYVYGPYVYLENGPCTIVIGMKVSDNTSKADSGLYIEIVKDVGDKQITQAGLTVRATDFTVANQLQYFLLPFTAEKGFHYEFRINPSSTTIATPATFYLDEAIICPFPLAPTVDLSPLQKQITANAPNFVELQSDSDVSYTSNLWKERGVNMFNLMYKHSDFPQVVSNTAHDPGAFWIGTAIVDRTLGTGRMEATQWDIESGKMVYKVERAKDDTQANWGAWTFIATWDYVQQQLTAARAFTLSFTTPVREYNDYYEAATQVQSIILSGASAIQYSLDGGAHYTTPTLPLPTDGSKNISIPAGTWVSWRITYSTGATLASAYIKLA